MESAKITDWISAIANTVMAGGVVFAWQQIMLLLEQNRQNHDRASRQLAVDLVQKWSMLNERKEMLAVRFIESLGKPLVYHVVKSEAMLVPMEKFNECADPAAFKAWFESTLEIIFEPASTNHVPVRKLDGVGGFSDHFYELSAREVALLRIMAVECLNRLEAILVAWWHHTADRRILEEQFRFVSRGPKRYFVAPEHDGILGDFRCVMDELQSAKFRRHEQGNEKCIVKSYPAIDEFVKLVRPYMKEQEAPPKAIFEKGVTPSHSQSNKSIEKEEQ